MRSYEIIPKNEWKQMKGNKSGIGEIKGEK